MKEADYTYRILRSARRTISIQILGDGSVLVCCPFGMGESQIRAFVESKRKWIQKHLGAIPAETVPVFSESEIDTMTWQAKSVLPSRVQSWASRMGLHYQKITIRHQRSRWGSCSSKGNLSFNCLLMQVPETVMDYVIVHELCHLKQMNHSSKFWAEVESVLPDYRQRKQWLKDHGAELIQRLPNPKGGGGHDGA